MAQTEKKGHDGHDHPFYGREILADREQEYIKNLLKKYKHEPASEELKKKILEELQMEAYNGNILIPFKVVLHKDAYGVYPDYVEVVLDTKV